MAQFSDLQRERGGPGGDPVPGPDLVTLLRALGGSGLGGRGAGGEAPRPQVSLPRSRSRWDSGDAAHFCFLRPAAAREGAAPSPPTAAPPPTPSPLLSLPSPPPAVAPGDPAPGGGRSAGVVPGAREWMMLLSPRSPRARRVAAGAPCARAAPAVPVRSPQPPVPRGWVSASARGVQAPPIRRPGAARTARFPRRRTS